MTPEQIRNQCEDDADRAPSDLTVWRDRGAIIAGLTARIAQLETERDTLAQAMWEARGVLGFDNDGDKTPGAAIAGMGYEWFAANHVKEAREQAKDYEDLLDLWDGTERREWVARAEAAEARVAAVLRECDDVPNAQTPLWPSMIRLAIQEAS